MLAQSEFLNLLRLKYFFIFFCQQAVFTLYVYVCIFQRNQLFKLSLLFLFSILNLKRAPIFLLHFKPFFGFCSEIPFMRYASTKIYLAPFARSV